MKRLIVLLLTGSLAPNLPAQDMLGDLRQQGRGFAQVVPGKPLQFPQDHAAHPDYRIEWWYLTANLEDRDGRHWGMQWTLFRQALSPQPVEGAWHSNQVWMGHAAITTPEGHFHEQRFARGGIGQAGVKLEQGFSAWMDDWHWHGQVSDSPFPARLAFNVGDREIVMQLEADGAPVANGVDGYSQKSAQGQASYYYSQPHLRVQGSVTRGTDEVRLSGQGWLDREWSSQALASNQQGWDWFSLHLSDGYKLMLYQLRHDDGRHWLSGNWIGPGGETRLLKSDDIDLQVSEVRQVDIDDTETRSLPMEWRVTLAHRPGQWRVRPLYDEQWMNTRFPYWEGVVLVEDEKGREAGIGYMELTGYQ